MVLFLRVMKPSKILTSAAFGLTLFLQISGVHADSCEYNNWEMVYAILGDQVTPMSIPGAPQFTISSAEPDEGIGHGSRCADTSKFIGNYSKTSGSDDLCANLHVTPYGDTHSLAVAAYHNFHSINAATIAVSMKNTDGTSALFTLKTELSDANVLTESWTRTQLNSSNEIVPTVVAYRKLTLSSDLKTLTLEEKRFGQDAPLVCGYRRE